MDDACLLVQHRLLSTHLTHIVIIRYYRGRCWSRDILLHHADRHAAVGGEAVGRGREPHDLRGAGHGVQQPGGGGRGQSAGERSARRGRLAGRWRRPIQRPTAQVET